MLGAGFALHQSRASNRTPVSLKVLARQGNRCFGSTFADFELRQIECWLCTLRWRDRYRPSDMCESLQ
jgi:hypothetical protein